jgi:NADPH:quinone reductase-like Zn-dependent oxidoreductase
VTAESSGGHEKMRVVLIERFGEPSEPRQREVTRPDPREGEVLVKVHAAAVNRSDILNARGLVPFKTLPRILGRDFAGVVVEGPRDLVGTEVWGTGGGDLVFTRDGTHAEYIVLPGGTVVPKPDNLSLEGAAASGLAHLAAASALLKLGGVSSGETVLVTGAAGGVESAAVKIARWKDARVIGAIKDASERETAQRMGVEVIVDTSREAVSEAAIAKTGGRGVDLVLDTVGGPLFEPGHKGRMVVITAVGETRVYFNLFDFYRKELGLFGLNTLMLDAERSATVLKDLIPGFEDRVLQAPPIAGRYLLEEARSAYALVESGEVQGRVLLIPG